MSFSQSALEQAHRLIVAADVRDDGREWLHDEQALLLVKECAWALIDNKSFDNHYLARQLALALHFLSISDDEGQRELLAAQIQDMARQAVYEIETERIKVSSAYAITLLSGSTPATAIPDLLGISASTWRRWQTMPPQTPPARLIVVASCVYWLRHGWTPAGVAAWFTRERYQLDGRTPLQLIEEDVAASYDILTDLAIGGMAQTAI